MPQYDAPQKTKTDLRKEFDANLWGQVLNIARQAIDSGDFDSETVMHILGQYAKGQNPGVKASDLRDSISSELAALETPSKPKAVDKAA